MNIRDFLFGAAVAVAIFGLLSPPRRADTVAANTSPFVGFQENDCSVRENRITDGECRFKLTPKTMTLSFVSQARFDAEIKDALGFARIDRDPCEIVIPAGAVITSIPRRNVALWSYEPGDYRRTETTLVHEILHCYVGRWHPEPAALYFNDYRDRKKDEPEQNAKWFHYRLPHLRSQNFELNKYLY